MAHDSLLADFHRSVLQQSFLHIHCALGLQTIAAITFHLLYLATRKRLDRSVPRKVYSWFFLVYRVCYATVSLLACLLAAVLVVVL